MKVAIMGTGGVGGYFGARLADSGCDVTFIARGAHLAAIKAHGLKVTSPGGDIYLREAAATSDPAEVGQVDVVIFTVKLWDTATAAEAVRPLLGPDTAVISFQNGVVKDDIIAAALGREVIVGGACYIGASIKEPGVIAHIGTMQKLIFGEYDGRLSDRANRFLETCRKAGIDAEVSADIRKTLWEKFVLLVGVSASTTTTRSPIGKVRADAGARHLLASVMQEAADIAIAESIQLAPDFVDDRLRFCDQMPESMTSSMHHDLQRGNRLEVEWLSGDVSRRGDRLGVATPVNRAVFDILSIHAGGSSDSPALKA